MAMSKGTKKTLIILFSIMFVIGAVFAFFSGTYNELVKRKIEVESSWANVETQYQRRLDLIPNLVSTVKGYASHESSTLENVVNARAKATQMNISFDQINDKTLAEFQKSQGELNAALSRLLAVTENYPDLKANQNFINLQTQLEGTENRIATSRRTFNEQVKSYNTYIQTFPRNIIAGMFNFTPKSFFAADTAAAQAPTVEF